MGKLFRDPVSGLTHFIAMLLAIVGLVVLLSRTEEAFLVEYKVTFAIFGGAMILLYLASTLYHWLPLSGERLELFRKIDHIMIFVFIAATYTPVCLLVLGGVWGWVILILIWTIAIAGLFFKIFWLNAPRILYTLVYVLMGWLVIVVIWPIAQAMAPSGFMLLLLGGAFYSVGAVIYASKRPNPWPQVFGFHEIFHIFIMLGSFAHFWMMYRYV